jgi:hypothetical protein
MPSNPQLEVRVRDILQLWVTMTDRNLELSIRFDQIVKAEKELSLADKKEENQQWLRPRFEKMRGKEEQN